MWSFHPTYHLRSHSMMSTSAMVPYLNIYK
jgi:hypothetical protein